MSRLTRSEIETMFDDLILAHPIYTPQLRALREQSLSQEAVRDEVIEEAARVADALTSKWHTDYKIGHGPHRASAHREGMSDGAEEVARELRALKREPNAAAQVAVAQDQAADKPSGNCAGGTGGPALAAPDVTHDWIERADDHGVYDCANCTSWTANLPLYKDEVCDAKERRFTDRRKARSLR